MCGWLAALHRVCICELLQIRGVEHERVLAHTPRLHPKREVAVVALAVGEIHITIYVYVYMYTEMRVVHPQCAYGRLHTVCIQCAGSLKILCIDWGFLFVPRCVKWICCVRMRARSCVLRIRGGHSSSDLSTRANALAQELAQHKSSGVMHTEYKFFAKYLSDECVYINILCL